MALNETREYAEPLSSSPLTPLRVARGCSCPARPRICSSGAAGRSRDGRGARCLPVYSEARFRFEFIAVVLSHVAYGMMPRGGLSLGLPSAGRRWVVLVLLLAALQWMEMAGDGAAPQSPFPNKLGLSGQILIERAGIMAVSPAGRGGEGRRWGGAHGVRSGFGAGELLQ